MMALALNNQRRLICHKTKKPNYTHVYISILASTFSYVEIAWYVFYDIDSKREEDFLKNYTSKELYRLTTAQKRPSRVSVENNAVNNLHSTYLWFRLFVIYYTFCLDVADGRMNGVPNETRTHSCRFVSLAR